MTRTPLPTDVRGVSEVIGSILVFGLVVALISMLQVHAVPNTNEEIEFEHSQQVRSDFTDLQVAVGDAVDTDRTKSTSVELGARYPPRLIFFNPPDTSGSLRTTETETITVRNVRSDSDAGVFFDEMGNSVTYDTRSLVYSIGYNELENSPRDVREPAATYRLEDDTALVSETNLVDGQEIDLLAIGGDLDASGVTAQKVDAKPLSGPAKTYTVTETGDPLTIEVPTRLSQSTWEDLLEDEMVSNGGYVSSVNVDPNNPSSGTVGTLTIEMQTGEAYEFRTSKVGFGQGDDPGPVYVVPVTNDDPDRAMVEVRDRFNNPVSGVTLDARSSVTIRNGGSSGTNIRVTTGPDGRASVERVGNNFGTVDFSEDLNDDGSVNPDLEEATASFGGNNAPIVLTDVTGTDGSSQIELTLQNEGPEREITRVQTHQITQVESQEVVLSVSISPPNVGSGENTNIVDGPDSINAFAGTGISSNAVEGEAPASISSSPTPLPAGTSTVTAQLNEPYSLSPQEAILVEFTVFYEGGHRERYSVHLFGNEA